LSGSIARLLAGPLLSLVKALEGLIGMVTYFRHRDLLG
jgi:hypothetical protein